MRVRFAVPPGRRSRLVSGLGPAGSGSKLKALRPHRPEKSGIVAAPAGGAVIAASRLNAGAPTRASRASPKARAAVPGLARLGLKIIGRPMANFLPLNDRDYLAGPSPAEIAKFSARDAEAVAPYTARLQAIADVLRGLILETPPNVTVGGWRQALP